MTLVVCDIDGTLVDHDKRLAPETIAAVARLRARSIAFTLISARPMSGIRPIADALAIDLPMGAFNGGLIFEASGAVREHHIIPGDVARETVALAADGEADLWVFADDQWFASTSEGPHVPREKLSSNQEPVIRAAFDDLLGRADKITFVSDEPAVLERVAAQVEAVAGGRATVIKSQPYFLDMTAPAGNKGDGIAALTRAAGVPLERTIAIGDQANDLAMFARAGRSIAMGNATPEVQAAADDVTTRNDAHGVAHAIDTLILGRMM